MRAKRATFTFCVDKSSLKNSKNGPTWRVFENPKACGQTELPDMSVLKGQKLVEMPKLKNSNATFWMIFKHCVMGKFTVFETQSKKVSFRLTFF